MTIASKEFGRRLRSERERRGILLETIADATKIKGSLLAELERGDVSKWPRGIFRRSFVRGYASAIGLSADDVAEEFFEIFPEDGATVARRPADKGALRLALADTSLEDRRTAALQALVALAEVIALAAVAWGAAWLARVDFPIACTALALSYYALASASWGRSPALHLLHRRHERPVTTSSADLLRLLVSQPEATQQELEAPRLSGATPAENFQIASR
jgi:transcriptional regulator with XRE-family HTH domain